MLFSCGNTTAEIAEISFEEGGPNEVTSNVTIYYSDSAIVRVKLTAPTIERYYGQSADEEESLFPDGVDVTFLSTKGEEESHITAQWAKRYGDGKLLEAKNDVVVVNQKGEKLNTEHLLWDTENHLITSNAFVKITQDDQIIYGDGLESNEDFTKYKINNIKAIIDVPDETEADSTNENL